jgi:pimeloyl-ACP methyl ester carboxylesterase
MLARFVLASLVLELALYVAVGAWLHDAHGWEVPGLVVAAILFCFGARFALVCTTSALGWFNRGHREPAHRIGIGGAVRYLAAEYLVLLLDNFWLLPFQKVALRPDPQLIPASRPPVVLVHGYMSNRGLFLPVVRALEGAGLGPVHAPNFPVVFASIEQYADKLHARVERIAQGCGQERVILVCHSMGGLAAREYLRRHGTKRVAKLVTIASPHHGTVLASMGLGLNARQMHRGSDFLRGLKAAEKASPPAIDALSIWTPHDNLVAPPETSILPWARSLPLPGVGHVSIVSAPRLLAALVAELRG